MALLDQVLGGVLGGGIGRGRSSGAMSSPVVKALLLALAAKAAQHHMAQRRTGAQDASHGGGLGGVLDGGLGGLLGGGGAGRLGGLLSGLAGAGGLGALVEHLQRNGQGEAVQSWVGRGENQRLEPQALAQALGPEAVEQLEQETGVPRAQLLPELAEELPDAVDRLTPEGRLPTEDELTRSVN